MGSFAMILVLTCLAAAPATSPSTQPAHEAAAAAEQLQACRQLLSDAQSSEATARENCLSKLHDSNVYKTQSAVVAEKERLRTEAKSGSDPQAKLQAASEYGTAVSVLQKMEVDAIKADADVAAAAQDVIELKAKLASAEKKLEDATATDNANATAVETEKVDADPILSAMRDHRLVAGMTLEQADQSLELNSNSEKEGASRRQDYSNLDGTSGYTWHAPRGIWKADVQDGKIVQATDWTVRGSELRRAPLVETRP